MMHLVGGLLSIALAASPMAPDRLVLRNARILFVSGGELKVIPHGSVVIDGGKIIAVGEAIPSPSGAEVVELEGRWVLPGFIDAHSQLGIRGESNEIASAVTEDLRPLDAFDPWDPEIELALRRGTTAIALSPGNRNVVGGAVALVKLIPGRVPVRVVDDRSALKGSVGRETLGSRSSPRYPTATSGAIQLLASWVEEAAAREERPALAGSGDEGGAESGERSVGLPPLLIQVDNRSQAGRVLGLLADSGRDAILLAGRSLEASALAVLSPAVPAVLGPFDLADGNRLLAGPATLERKGIPLAFAGSGERRDLLTTAVLAMRAGLSRAGALAALTETPAGLYGVSGQLGSVERGKDADLVVWSGDPFTLAARVEMVLIDGEVVYRAASVPPPAPDSVLAPDRSSASAPLLTSLEARKTHPLTGGSPDESQPETIVIRAGRVHPVSSAPIEHGQILVRAGKIVSVGKKIEVPEDARVINIPDGQVFPGLIDAGSPLGLPGRHAEEFSELTPEIRVVDSVDRDSREIERALRSGVTTVAITAGDRNVIGGLGVVIKTAPHQRREDVLRPDAFLSASLVRAATSDNMTLRGSAPFSFYHRLPTTRMGTVFLLRRSFFEALDLKLPGGVLPGEDSTLARLLTSEGKAVLAETLRGKRSLRLRADTREEIEAALRIAAEFETSITIEGFEEGMDLIGRIAEGGHAVLIPPGGVPLSPPRVDGARLTLRLAHLLSEQGVDFAFASRAGVEVANLREQLLFSVRYGLSSRAALRAATLGAARLLGIEDRVGSLEPGKDADLVIVRGGGPLEAFSRVDRVMVDGKIYFAQPGAEEESTK